MIMDDPKDLFNKLESGDEETITALGSYLWSLANRVRNLGFLSTSVPNVPNGHWVAFIYYKGNFSFLVKYKNGATYYKRLETPEDVFTPNVIDISNVSPISKEDAIARSVRILSLKGKVE